MAGILFADEHADIGGARSGERPLLSICIPAYNAEEVIGECLASIAGQDFGDYEVVIVDDGSGAQLALGGDALAGLDANRVRLIRQENGGTYAARQRAISEARGCYVFCMDADDALVDMHALGRIAGALEANSFPDVLLSNAVREDGSRCVDYGSLVDGSVERAAVVRRFFLDTGWNSMFTMVFRRTLFKPAPGRPRLLMAEDRLQKAEIFAAAGTFALCDEAIYLYRDVAGSAMNRPFEERDFYNRAYVGVETLGMLDDLGATRGEWARSFNGYVFASLFGLFMDTRRSRAERMGLYPEFRSADGCEAALAYASDFPARKDRVCLETFRDRRWGLLDSLLAGRCLASRAKHALER